MTLENWRQRSRRRRGLSLMEVVVSTLLVGVVLVGALRCAGGVITGRVHSGDSARAALLAHLLLTEIVVKNYLDEGASPVFGPEETSTLRLPFDDVDDFHGWSAMPPERGNGVKYTDFQGWRREVSVEWVSPTNPATVVGSDQGVKRITVTVSRAGATLAEVVAIRTEKYIVQ